MICDNCDKRRSEESYHNITVSQYHSFILRGYFHIGGSLREREFHLSSYLYIIYNIYIILYIYYILYINIFQGMAAYVAKIKLWFVITVIILPHEGKICSSGGRLKGLWRGGGGGRWWGCSLVEKIQNRVLGRVAIRRTQTTQKAQMNADIIFGSCCYLNADN